jgi:CRISPR/Cas system-associated protein Csm6
MMGRSHWSLFNSVWAMSRTMDFVPERVHILTAGCDKNAADKAALMVRGLLSELKSGAEVLVQVISEEDASEIADKVKKLATMEKEQGNQVALDVTPGKKTMIIGAILASSNLVDHVFYLHIESLKNADRPFLEIPLSVQHSHDFLSEVRMRRQVSKEGK